MEPITARTRTIFLIVLALILITRAPMLWETYMHSDEALFLLSSKLWRLGGIPYVTWFETKPLGVYLYYSLGDIRIVHFITLLWTLLTAWALYGIALKIRVAPEKKNERAAMAAIAFVLFSTFWDPTIVSVSIEVVLLLPWCLCILLLPTDPQSATPTRSVLSGLMAAAAFLCKYQAGILLPIVALYYWVILWRWFPEWRFKKALSHSLLFGLGFLPLPILMLAYLLHRGSWEGFVFWNVYGNAQYISDGNAVVALGRKIVTQVFRYLASTALLWFLAADRLLSLWRKRRDLAQESSAYESLIWVWLLLSWIPVSVGKRFEDHYFLFLTPALCVLAATALSSWPLERRLRWRAALTAAVLVPALAFTITRYAVHPLNHRFDGEDMNDYRPYADYLRQRTKPGDAIFVWGCAPAVYLYADRLPATRFLRTDVLAGRVPGYEPSSGKPFEPQRYVVAGTWDMFFEDVARHPPAYIMDTAPTGLHDFRLYPMTSSPLLMDYLKRNYVKETPFRNADVYRRKDLAPFEDGRASGDSSLSPPPSSPRQRG